MLPPSGKPNKSGSILEQNGHRQTIWFPAYHQAIYYHLPSCKKKKKITSTFPKQPLVHSSSPIRNTAWPVTQTTSHETPLTILRSVCPVLWPTKDDTGKHGHIQMFICSECIYSNSNVCCLKHLLNHCRHIFPLQTIKTTANPGHGEVGDSILQTMGLHGL